jgi:hypothetical protein
MFSVFRLYKAIQMIPKEYIELSQVNVQQTNMVICIVLLQVRLVYQCISISIIVYLKMYLIIFNLKQYQVHLIYTL